MSIGSFERYPLLFGPSPVHPLERLSAHLGGGPVWAKREDCNSGIAYGGNKTRKLEYLVADALAKGCDTLVSIGGVQSNHTRQVAAVAARVGLGCLLLQESWVNWPDAVYDKVGNILISRLAGADVRLAARTEGMITDPVYEGKSMAGLIDLIGRREIEPASTVLYAHLGGQPALNAYSALFS